MMIDREELIRGLSICSGRPNEDGCLTCGYFQTDVMCIDPLMSDALQALREDADEIEQLRDQVYNLTLYLRYVERTVPTIVESMSAQFSGMPGYAGKAVDA